MRSVQALLRMCLMCCLVAVGLGAGSAVVVAEETVRHSLLWGGGGESWDPAGRLSDFSHAGYRRGESPLPDVPVAANVRDFGARGDGEHDDTAAIEQAIAATEAGAIFFPPGRYLITDIIEIRKPGIVLRGAGPDETILFFPRPLNAIRPNMGATTGGRPTSNYSWSGGLIWVRGDFQSAELARVTEPGRRGEVQLIVSSIDGLSIGQSIEIQQRDEPENTLAAHLYGGDPGDTANLNGRARASLVARIIGMEGVRITIDRPLRFDIEQRWQPRVLRFEPTVGEVGIEHLAFEFPVRPYEGHFTEEGYNAIAFSGVADSWVRNVVINHCDSGIFSHSRFCTFEGIVFNSDREPDGGGNVGHHGVTFSGDDNLLAGFRYNLRLIHDITMTAFAAGNVVSEGSGVDLCFDHHRRGPNNNLFTDIDIGAGSRMYRSGGGAALGRHSAAWLTFWNIRADLPQQWPPERFAPDLINFIGVRTEEAAIMEPDGKWLEPIPPQLLEPQNLHHAQLQRRLADAAEAHSN